MSKTEKQPIRLELYSGDRTNTFCPTCGPHSSRVKRVEGGAEHRTLRKYVDFVGDAVDEAAFPWPGSFDDGDGKGMHRHVGWWVQSNFECDQGHRFFVVWFEPEGMRSDPYGDMYQKYSTCPIKGCDYQPPLLVHTEHETKDGK